MPDSMTDAQEYLTNLLDPKHGCDSPKYLSSVRVSDYGAIVHLFEVVGDVTLTPDIPPTVYAVRKWCGEWKVVS